MFHFTGYRVSFRILFRKERWLIKTIRLPHSEISGSKRICRSPKLIAAYHVLHRLLAPRHPLCALKSLIPCLKSAVKRRVRPKPPLLHNAPEPKFRRCRKNFVFGNQNIFKDHVRTAHGICSRSFSLFAVNQIIFLSIWMSKSGLRFFCVRNLPCIARKMVGLIGLEPMTPALSRRCSNQLSYRPLLR
jgi:hypothetical protein